MSNKIAQELLVEHAARHQAWLTNGHHKEGVDPIALYGLECKCDGCCAIRKGTWNVVRYYYGWQPCFCLVVEKQFNNAQFSEKFLKGLYAIWEDGVSMGRYCEATKDAEGS